MLRPLAIAALVLGAGTADAGSVHNYADISIVASTLRFAADPSVTAFDFYLDGGMSQFTDGYGLFSATATSDVGGSGALIFGGGVEGDRIQVSVDTFASATATTAVPDSYAETYGYALGNVWLVNTHASLDLSYSFDISYSYGVDALGYGISSGLSVYVSGCLNTFLGVPPTGTGHTTGTCHLSGVLAAGQSASFSSSLQTASSVVAQAPLPATGLALIAAMGGLGALSATRRKRL